MKVFTFYSRDMSASIDGAVFHNHLYQTMDESQAERLRKSFYFNRSFSEIDTKIDDIPDKGILTDEEQKRFDELVGKGKHTTPQEKAELKILKDKKEGK